MPHTLHKPNAQLSDWIVDQFPEGYCGFAVDVGASDGISINTTWRLEKFERWTVLSVEPNPQFLPALRRERAFVEACACAAASGQAVLTINQDNPEAYSALRVLDHPEVRRNAGGFWTKVSVRVETVDALLHKWEFPRLDALCIDVEGGEAAVLSGARLDHWKPHAILVESWDQGALDSQLCPLGYRRVWRSVADDCYLREES